MSEFETTIAGAQAADYKVIRLDSLADAHKGILLEADVTAGTFAWKDHVNAEVQRASLGPHQIKIVRR